MIQKLVDYVKSKVKNLEIQESKSTNSVYIQLDLGKIRISDHIGMLKPEVKVQVIIPEESSKFIVCIGLKMYLYNTIRQVGDFLINYIRINNNIITQVYNEKKTKLQELSETADNLRSQLTESSKLKSDLDTIIEKYKTLKSQYTHTTNLQSSLKQQLKEKDSAIKEAAELIEQLYNPETRKLIYSEKKDKRYYLDNFSDDAREMIEELIKEYYSK